MKCRVMTFIIILSLYFICFTNWVNCQRIIGSNINGHVLDSQTKQPLQNVNVYLAYSKIGTTTDQKGNFKFPVLAPGSYQLIFSHVGYDTRIEDLRIVQPDEFTFSIQLNPKLIQLPVVNVLGEEDFEWRKNLKLFIEQLIGVTKNAGLTKLLNPKSLNFKTDEDGILFAESGEPLQIMNNALGYEIQYFMEYFEYGKSYVKYCGVPTFKEIEPNSEQQKTEWIKNRETAYNGSLRHFLNTICNNYFLTRGDTTASEYEIYPADTNDLGTKVTYAVKSYIEQEGFDVIHTNTYNNKSKPFPFSELVNTNTLIRKGDISSEMKLVFEDYLQVIYMNEKEEEEYLDALKLNRYPRNQLSWIELQTDTVNIDIYGRYYDKFQIKTYGYWGFERLADMLPIDYNVYGIKD